MPRGSNWLCMFNLFYILAGICIWIATCQSNWPIYKPMTAPQRFHGTFVASSLCGSCQRVDLTSDNFFFSTRNGTLLCWINRLTLLALRALMGFVWSGKSPSHFTFDSSRIHTEEREAIPATVHDPAVRATCSDKNAAHHAIPRAQDRHAFALSKPLLMLSTRCPWLHLSSPWPGW